MVSGVLFPEYAEGGPRVADKGYEPFATCTSLTARPRSLHALPRPDAFVHRQVFLSASFNDALGSSGLTAELSSLQEEQLLMHRYPVGHRQTLGHG